MNRARYVAQAGMVAAVYAAVTVVVSQLPFALSWGIIQFRLSEAVTVLAMFTPAAIPGLALGSVLANLLNLGQTGPFGWLDVVFGSLGTLLGAMWTWKFRKNAMLALAGPVISNALIVPAYLPLILVSVAPQLYTLPILGTDLTGSWIAMYLFGVVTVGFGQAVVVYSLGLGLMYSLRRLKLGEVLDSKR